MYNNNQLQKQEIETENKCLSDSQITYRDDYMVTLIKNKYLL